jgi:YbbR domain-containing protein
VTRVTLRRVLARIVHNWPLKLAAVGLATLLYAGVVLSQNVQTFPGPVQIDVVNQPTNAVIVGNLPSVTDIRYVAPTGVGGELTNASFHASIDLSGVNPTADQRTVSAEVHLNVADQRVNVLSYQPHFINVQLDPLISNTVPIQVKQGAIPSGLDVQAPKLSATTAVVSGPESKVRLVVAAEAQVLIQAPGLDVHEDVPLIAVDGLDNAVSPVDIEPQTVHVDIAVGSQTVSRTLPVNPVVTGSPANGFRVASVTVNPVVVNLRGDADTLAGMTSADTAPISIAQATTTESATVPLALPNGVDAPSGGTVSVTIKVEAVSGTRTFSAGLVLAGARDDRRYSLSTDQVAVTVGGPVASLATLQGTSFTGTLDVSSLAIGRHDVAVKVSVPAGLTVDAISPTRVTVTVAAVPPSPTPPPAASPSPSPS